MTIWPPSRCSSDVGGAAAAERERSGGAKASGGVPTLREVTRRDSHFVCQGCGHVALAWTGRCPGCGRVEHAGRDASAAGRRSFGASGPDRGDPPAPGRRPARPAPSRCGRWKGPAVDRAAHRGGRAGSGAGRRPRAGIARPARGLAGNRQEHAHRNGAGQPLRRRAERPLRLG